MVCLYKPDVYAGFGMISKRGAEYMDKMIVVGNDIYDEFIRDDGYYVDKTELIYIHIVFPFITSRMLFPFRIFPLLHTFDLVL